jgi:murein L,D-transpeptidase YcbB/YkuD
MNDEFYFQKRGFRALDSTYSWGEPRLYQLPGGKNPLGKAKFLFDNPYGFYLHDTPEQHLFKRASRAISHGCIRVERALDLAREILTKENPKRAEQIESYLKKPDQTYITLENPVPIVITYFPVSAGEDGLLEFGGDPYGWEDTNGFKGFFYVKNDQGM